MKKWIKITEILLLTLLSAIAVSAIPPLPPGFTNYTLLVSSGTGGGTNYDAGEKVEIVAQPVPAAKFFTRWSGDTQHVASVTSSTTTVTMPATNIMVVADFGDLTYTLTVNSGTGDGVYTNGQQVEITAGIAPTNQVFDRWTGDTQVLASITSSPTTVTMSTQNISLTATYKNLPGYYTLTVNNGTGSGIYTNGQQVEIVADVAPTHQVFDRWTGSTQVLASVTSSTTVATMSTQNVSLTATYKNDADYYTLVVNSGTGSGVYTNGEKVNISADRHAGLVFYRWTGAIQYVSNAVASPTVVTMPAWAISLNATYLADTNIPGLRITAPTAGLKVRATNGLFTIRGAAADNRIVANVLVKLNNDSYVSAGTTDGWRTWSLPVTLTPGTNTILAYCEDLAINSSLISTVMCVYVETTGIAIQTNGAGSVTLSPAGIAEVGKTYTLTATAKPGSLFSHWTGSMPTTNRVVMFTMEPGKTVTANFTDIAKPTVVIKTPTALQKVYGTNGNFTVTGTATDNLALSNVLVSVNSGLFTPAITTNACKSWSLPVVLSTSLGGTNIIAAYSVDTTGNSSVIVTTKCVYVETGTLNIITNGPGKVTVAPTGPLVLGKTYTLTAAANAGGVFSNWTGAVSNPTNKATAVIITSNMTVAANFTDTAKPTVVITYPANNAKVMTNGLVIIRGTAADNGVLSEVKYQIRTGDWTNAVSTNIFKAWTAPYVPATGLNTSKVYSVDAQGNHSATSTVVFSYIPGAMLTVQTNTPARGTITPSLNGKVLQIGSTNTMTAAAKTGYIFTNWTYGVGGTVATNTKAVKFVMTTNLVLTANFVDSSGELPFDAVADVLAAGIVVDGSSKDWMDVPRSTFSYSSVTQEVAVALDGNSIALLLNGCPFSTSDTVLVYFKLRLTYGVEDNCHTVDLWTSGEGLYGMVDGQVITGLEAILLNGVLEAKIPIEHTPSQVTIEEVGCGMDLGDGTLTEIFRDAFL
jgi:hypothetical protein